MLSVLGLSWASQARPVQWEKEGGPGGFAVIWRQLQIANGWILRVHSCEGIVLLALNGRVTPCFVFQYVVDIAVRILRGR